MVSSGVPGLAKHGLCPGSGSPRTRRRVLTASNHLLHSYIFDAGSSCWHVKRWTDLHPPRLPQPGQGNSRAHPMRVAELRGSPQLLENPRTGWHFPNNSTLLLFFAFSGHNMLFLDLASCPARRQSVGKARTRGSMLQHTGTNAQRMMFA